MTVISSLNWYMPCAYIDMAVFAHRHSDARAPLRFLLVFTSHTSILFFSFSPGEQWDVQTKTGVPCLICSFTAMGKKSLAIVEGQNFLL